MKVSSFILRCGLFSVSSVIIYQVLNLCYCDSNQFTRLRGFFFRMLHLDMSGWMWFCPIKGKKIYPLADLSKRGAPCWWRQSYSIEHNLANIQVCPLLRICHSLVLWPYSVCRVFFFFFISFFLQSFSLQCYRKQLYWGFPNWSSLLSKNGVWKWSSYLFQ